MQSVVLVHGGFVDESGRQGLHELLTTHRPERDTSLVGDVAVTKRTLAEQSGPAVLVGHSYGGP